MGHNSTWLSMDKGKKQKWKELAQNTDFRIRLHSITNHHCIIANVVKSSINKSIISETPGELIVLFFYKVYGSQLYLAQRGQNQKKKWKKRESCGSGGLAMIHPSLWRRRQCRPFATLCLTMPRFATLFYALDALISFLNTDRAIKIWKERCKVIVMEFLWN